MLWVTIIIGFLIYGIYIIQGLVYQWEENVDITTIKNYSADVRNIQFPTVTVCPKGWPNDRWGFVRANLNEIDMENYEAIDNLSQEWNFFMEKYYMLILNGLKNNYVKGDIFLKGKVY